MTTPRGRGPAAIAICMVLCVAIGVYGWLSIREVDTQQFLYFFSILSPTLGMIWTAFKTEKIEKKVDEVAEHTNGQLTAALDEMPEQVANQVVEKLNDDNGSKK